MIPTLYNGNETQFLTNGIGRLPDATECTVEENLNGLYELTMKYPITGLHYEDLEIDRLILAVPFDGGDPQPFRIYDISRALDGMVEVHAEHISYLLNKIVTMPFTATSCSDALGKLKTNAANTCPFTFSTTKSVSKAYTVSEPQAIRGLLGGQEGSILEVFGKGEYEFNRFNVKLWTNRGSDNGVTLRYGKNITELVRDSDITNAYTGIVPFWTNNEGTIVTLTEKVVWSEHRDAFAYDLVKAVDLSSAWEEAPTESQLRTRAQQYVANNEGWTVNDNIKVSFVALWQTEEYKNIAVLERVHMGDTVTVIYEALGVESSAKVNRTVWNVLLDRYDEIELGAAKNTLAQVITDPIMEEIPTSSDMEKAIAHGTKLITGGLGGYVFLKPNANGEPEEILVMNNKDYTQASKLWRFNKNGLGYSETGYNGTYKQAWTMDGAFYTDWVTAGKMTASLIKTGQIVGQTSNSMTIDVDDGTITLGNSNKLKISAGNLKLDASGNLEITGKVTATSGYIGGLSGFSIDSTKIYNGKSTLNGTSSGVYVGTNGISVGEFVGGNADGTGFKVTSGGLVTTGGIKFFTGSGTSTTTYGLWAKGTGGTHIGSGGPCDFNSEGDGTANKRNYLRNGTTLSGGVDINGGLGLSGDLQFDTSHGYNIRGVDEISARGTIYTSGRCEAYYGKFTTCQADNFVPSDRRIKEDITPLRDSEAFVDAIEPVRFKYKTRDGYHHGFIAQNIQEALQDECNIVITDPDGMLAVNYNEITADLVVVVQNQKKRIDDLEARLARLEAMLEGDGK